MHIKVQFTPATRDRIRVWIDVVPGGRPTDRRAP